MSVSETYAPAICGDGTEGTSDFDTLVSKVNELAAKHGVSEGIKWGNYDVWNDYNKIVLSSIEDIRVSGEEGDYDSLYVGLVFPGELRPLRTPSTDDHYSVHYDEVPHLTVMYDDFAEITYEENTPWGSFAAEFIAYLRETVPQD